ncbi:hypothetical protein [Metabacillus fastidiosus]|uniref:hypothetical protein n=1 Tax=Metabacillus fastidiosus TaxID=1458 RepID=UPI003D2E2083
MEEDITAEEFVDYVKFMLQSVQMTQRQLGEAIGFERRTIMNWEKGKSLPFDVY